MNIEPENDGLDDDLFQRCILRLKAVNLPGCKFVFSSPQAPLATGVHVATMPWDFSQTMPLICCGVWHKPIYIYIYLYIYRDIYICIYIYIYVHVQHIISNTRIYIQKYNHSIYNSYMYLKHSFHFCVMYHIMNAKKFNTISGGQIPRWICFFVLSVFNLARQMWLENWAPWKVNLFNLPFLCDVFCVWRKNETLSTNERQNILPYVLHQRSVNTRRLPCELQLWARESSPNMKGAFRAGVCWRFLWNYGHTVI